MTAAAPTALLETALTSWRRTGAPEDAAALEAHARAALAGWTPPITSSPGTFHRAWLRAAKDDEGSSPCSPTRCNSPSIRAAR